MSETNVCTNMACLVCFRSAAIEISHAITLSNKPSSALGRDGASMARAFKFGVETGNGIFGRTKTPIDRQRLICECSFGPFPREVEDLMELQWTRPEKIRAKSVCTNVEELINSFCGAKKSRGKSPSSWHGAFELALKVASENCALQPSCRGEVIQWRENSTILNELTSRGFRWNI